MSDLQCPARIFLAREDQPQDAIPLPERLRGERIAHVYTTSVALAVLEEIADGHRGEAVLVVGKGEDIAETLAALALPSSPSGYVANGDYVLLERDADGWRLG